MDYNPDDRGSDRTVGAPDERRSRDSVGRTPMRVLGALLGVLALTTLPGVTSCNVMCTDENGVKYACVQCYVWESVPCMAHVWHLPVGAKCLDAQRPALPDGTACSVDGIENGVCNAAVCEHDKFPCTEQGIRDAIALGGGPHTFACDGPTTVTTQAEIVIDNSVIRYVSTTLRHSSFEFSEV